MLKRKLYPAVSNNNTTGDVISLVTRTLHLGECRVWPTYSQYLCHFVFWGINMCDKHGLGGLPLIYKNNKNNCYIIERVFGF